MPDASFRPTTPGVGPGVAHDLMIAGFDNQARVHRQAKRK
jgi:hypothetical protein